MFNKIENLVFEGGGILGVSYLGVLDYLFRNGHMEDVTRVAGTSAGAVTACITSFNLPFGESRKICNTLDYRLVPSKGKLENFGFMPEEINERLEKFLGDMSCVYRLINRYGWFSTEYFYDWIKGVIGDQFDPTKKAPPYTFADFKDPMLHKDGRPFLDLYVVGTDISLKTTQIFSYDTTPKMEVAQAVRISMSVPIFFEAVIRERTNTLGNSVINVFCDGGLLHNYPLNIFDYPMYSDNLYDGVNMSTLGVRFKYKYGHTHIDNLWQYIDSLLRASTYIQQQIYESNPLNKERSITVDTSDIQALDFDIDVDDVAYRFLYRQGYEAAKEFFSDGRYGSEIQ